jgi:hypothetical protein
MKSTDLRSAAREILRVKEPSAVSTTTEAFGEISLLSENFQVRSRTVEHRSKWNGEGKLTPTPDIRTLSIGPQYPLVYLYQALYIIFGVPDFKKDSAIIIEPSRARQFLHAKPSKRAVYPHAQEES